MTLIDGDDRVVLEEDFKAYGACLTVGSTADNLIEGSDRVGRRKRCLKTYQFRAVMGDIAAVNTCGEGF